MANLLGSLTSRIVNTVKSNVASFFQSQQIRHGHAFPQFAKLPPVNKAAGKGSSFETRVQRKRVLPDPNKPNFDHIEPLKWATWRMLRDVRRRHIFKDFWFDRACLDNLSRNKLLPNSIRETAHEKRCNVLPRDSTYEHLRNRCAVTGRSRGIVKRYRLSRLAWRNLADNNKLSGVIKSSWR